jgi:LPXTG-motif cell wall-anchored protein
VSSSAATGGAVAAPAPPAAAETLPATGVDVRVIALVGAILLAAGLALRRRVRVRR